MIDPSVKVILAAHSMGGIVAADTLLSILDDEPISTGSEFMDVDKEDESTTSKDPRLQKQDSTENGKENKKKKEDGFIFPAISGIIAFDTPYIGLAPSMFANSADSNFRAASDAFTQVSGIATALGIFGTASTAVNTTPAKSSSGKPAAALPAPPSTASGWQWGKIAAYAGAASTVAAGATAAYLKRTEITEGFSWVSSHLEFVSVLMKINDLKLRMIRVSNVNGVGIANFYTLLGKGATPATTAGGKILTVGGEGVRTFCSLPQVVKTAPGGKEAIKDANRGTTDVDFGQQDMRKWWHAALNDKAADEVHAHVGMFHPSTNTGYKELVNEARLKILDWTMSWCDADLA